MVDERTSTTTRFYQDGLTNGGRVLEDVDGTAAERMRRDEVYRDAAEEVGLCDLLD